MVAGAKDSAGWIVLVLCGVLAACSALAAEPAAVDGQAAEPPFELPPLELPSEPPSAFPQIPTPPPSEMPSPVAPSKPPDAAGAAREVAPVTEIPGDFIEFHAADLRTTYEDGVPVLTVAKGMVSARHKDMLITADAATADYKTNLAVFQGDVLFKAGVQEARGEQIELNMRTGDWSVTSATASISPQFLKGYIVAPLYARTERIRGQRARQFTAFGAGITSCNLAAPHYDLVSRSVAVYPEDKIVFRDVTAYVFGRRLFTLRRLVVPIRNIEKNPTLIPTVGQSLEEGAYLKTAFAYMGNRTQSGVLLLDLMSRKGVGTGLRHNYKFPNASGELYAYFIRDRNIDQQTFTGRFSHDQRLGTVKVNIASDFRANSYLYAPDSKTLINRFTLTRNRPGAFTSLAVNQSVNETFVRTSNLSGILRHRQLFGEDKSLDASFDYLAFNSPGHTRSRLTSEMVFLSREDKFDWSLSATELTDLSDEAFVGGGLFAGVERLPEVALMTDTARLGKIIPFGIPARLRLSYGKFAELPANVELDRTLVEINSPTQRRALSHTWTLGAGAGFRQYFYGDGTAQYSIDAGLELRKKIGRNSGLAFTYRLQQPRGFTPFRFDFVGRYNIVNASLNLRETERFKLSLLGGYNFEQKRFPWQDVVLRCSVQPSPSFLLYTATGYDINNSRWRTLINQLRFRAGEDFKLDVGTRYDPTRNRLATARAQLDTKLGSKYRLQALAGYNGLTKQFDYRSFMLTRDLHCWEASLVFVDQGGFYKDKAIYINFRIKAFPLFENYGIGPYGQALDTSVGQIY